MRGACAGVRGFTMIEAMLVMIVIGIAFFGFGYLFGNIDQHALKADQTILATKLAREKLEEVVQQKADAGYASVVTQAPSSVTSGAWSFTRGVTVNYVNATDFSNAVTDTGYKKVVVTVAWGAGTGQSIALTTLVTDMVPSEVTGTGFAPCP